MIKKETLVGAHIKTDGGLLDQELVKTGHLKKL